MTKIPKQGRREKEGETREKEKREEKGKKARKKRGKREKKGSKKEGKLFYFVSLFIIGPVKKVLKKQGRI